MSATKKPITQAVVSYPDVTSGSGIAARTRAAANKWPEEKRAALFEQGMQIIYGGSRPKEKVRS